MWINMESNDESEPPWPSKDKEDEDKEDADVDDENDATDEDNQDEDEDKDKDKDKAKDKDKDKDQEDQPSAGTSYGPNLTANPSQINITPRKFQSAEFDMLPMQLFDLNLGMIAEESENGD